MTFWGVEIKPGQPFILPSNGSKLRLTQAILGDSINGGSGKCSILYNIDGNVFKNFCNLIPDTCETRQIHAEFQEPQKVVFSVVGPMSVHLIGYFKHFGGHSIHSYPFEKLTIKVPSGFELEKAVCNHGFFMMAPNLWIPKTKTLQRPLRLSDLKTSVNVSITSSRSHVKIKVDVGSLHLSHEDHQIIITQVCRMLRLTAKDVASIEQFQEAYPPAKQSGFGRLFRSPSLFEDSVKCILLCNCRWKRSLEMVEKLCKLSSNSEVVGNFPNAMELAGLDPKFLADKCTIGYRAVSIINLAKKVVKGTLVLDDEKLVSRLLASDQYKVSFYNTIFKVHGFGSFVSSNVMMCIGIYDYLPVDSETYRHVNKIPIPKKKKKGMEKDVKEAYKKYAPFQTLVYWFELIQSYEAKVGKLSELEKSQYSTITGRLFNSE